MSSNMQRLGDTLAQRMKRSSAAAVPTTIELGTIHANLSLTTDSLKTPIPKGDYMINITLASSTYRTEVTTHGHDQGTHTHSGGTHDHEGIYTSGSHTHSGGAHTHVGGAHDHRLPDVFGAVKAGDRVLVAWCGNEPVVIAVVVTS